MISKAQNKVRIIAGRFRGRKLDFPNIEGLRPTPNRVRETLFNWLSPVIVGTECLDLFAGSGALGFEALSRGAKRVVFVDDSIEAIKHLKTTLATLSCDQSEILHLSALEFLKDCHCHFDIVFLDPPFSSNLIEKCCNLIADHKILKEGGVIYLETSVKTELSFLPSHWETKKVKKAGQVKYLLLQQSKQN